jgi:predicted kinase
MQKVIILKGLQGSGKTTWAKQFIEEHHDYKRVSKDDMRLMLDNSRHSKGNENFVIRLRNHIILETLKDHKNILVDDTNLNPVHEKQIQELVRGLAEVEFVSFLGVPIEDCIANDLKRLNSVGEKVIRQTYNQWIKPLFICKGIVYNPDLPDAIICDMDGTLALFGDKNPYSRDFEDDEVNIPVADILWKYKDENIILVSGRSDMYRNQTLLFLRKSDINFTHLFMRKNDDNRKDSIVKQEIYDNEIKDKYNILFVLDDRNSVVSMWRSNGLTCMQVSEGDF